MEKDQMEQVHDITAVCKMLQNIAEECHATEEERYCQSILQEVQQTKQNPGYFLNRIAGNLLLNHLEPRLIVAVMDGEDMREKLKMLQPRISSTKARLEQQVLQQQQKMERQIVKYVMNFEAAYHIMIRKIRDDFRKLEQPWEEELPLLMEETLQTVVEQEEDWCVEQLRKDIQELEAEMIAFTEDLYAVKSKCRQETIQIMDNSFFTMIAEKTERALKMISYRSAADNMKLIRKRVTPKAEHHKLIHFSVEPQMSEWASKQEEPVSKLLETLSQKFQKESMQEFSRAIQLYNDFLKKYLELLMKELRKEATEYLEALEKQLTNAVTGEQMRTHVDRDELQHLVDMRNQIAWTFEAMEQEKSV